MIDAVSFVIENLNTLADEIEDKPQKRHVQAPPLPPQSQKRTRISVHCHMNSNSTTYNDDSTTSEDDSETSEDDSETSDDDDDYYKTNPKEIDYEEVDELELKILFRRYVESTWFWRKDLVKNIETYEFNTDNCYYINVESYYEIRKIRTEVKQYSGEAIDSRVKRDDIDLYEYKVDYPEMFEITTDYYTIPHSERIIICNKCRGNGKILCKRCKNGYVECESCQIQNYLYSWSCRECMGSGRKICRDCSGTGTRICNRCIGTGKRIEYDELCINYYTLNLEEVVNPTMLDSSTLRSNQGITMIDVEHSRLKRFEWSKYPMINSAINKLLKQADIRINNYDGRLIIQRAVIKVIPISHILTTDNYDIYCIGINKKLESPNYPSSCSIM